MFKVFTTATREFRVKDVDIKCRGPVVQIVAMSYQ